MVLQIVAGAERFVARAGDDCDPEIGVLAKAVEDVGQLLVRHGVEGVIDLRPIDGDDQYAAFGFGLAIFTHCSSLQFNERMISPNEVEGTCLSQWTNRCLCLPNTCACSKLQKAEKHRVFGAAVIPS